jgi:hypothetical protein
LVLSLIASHEDSTRLRVAQLSHSTFLDDTMKAPQSAHSVKVGHETRSALRSCLLASAQTAQ